MMQDKDLHIRIDAVRYPGSRVVLRDVDVTLPAGSFTAVIGRNGSGKSTLLSCAAGLLSFSGTVTYGGIRLDTLSCAARARLIAPHHDEDGVGKMIRKYVLSREDTL